MKSFLKYIPKDNLYKSNSINKKDVFLINFLILSPFLAIYNFKLFLISLPFFIIGYLDDIYDLSIKRRFLSTIFILALIFFFFYELQLKNIIFNDQLIILNKFYSFIISSILILGFIHVMNMSDGRNSNYGMYVLILFLTIFVNILTITNEINKEIILICFSISFICILNYRSFSFFGNNGVYALSFFIGILMFEYYGNFILSSKNIYCIFFIPFIDSIFVSGRRVLNGHSPFKSDLFHLHHLPNNWDIGIISQFLVVSFMVFLSYFLTFILLIIISIPIYFILRNFFEKI